MTRTMYWQQVLALVRRNWLYKIRTKKITIQELIYPPVFVALLMMMHMLMKAAHPTVGVIIQPEVAQFPSHSISQRSSLLSNVELFVSPDSKDALSIVNSSLDLLSFAAKVVAFKTRQDAYMAYLNYSDTDGIIGIDFSELSLNTASYTVRLPHSLDLAVETLLSDQSNCTGNSDGLGHCMANSYIYSDFIELQVALDTVLIKRFSSDFLIPDLSIQLLPKRSSSSKPSSVDVFYEKYNFVLPFVFVMAYSCFVQYITLILVYERVSGTREHMALMGVKLSAYWTSWLIVYAGFIFIVTAVIGETASNLATLLTWAMGMVCLGIMEKRGGHDDEGTVPGVPVGVQYLLCLMSPVALVLGLDQAHYVGKHHGGLNIHTVSVGNVSFAGALAMLIADCILYRCVAWYLEAVFEGTSKRQKSALFCCLRSFWTDRCCRNRGRGGLIANEDVDAADDEATSSNAGIKFEDVPASIKKNNAIRLRNVTKIFRANKAGQPALDGLNLEVFEGQITALIGHNGAGKTTLLRILTGSTSISQGSASIYGLNVTVSRDMERIRSMCGVCFQHDVLLDQLTVTEHLEIYARLKSVPASSIQTQVQETISSLGLESCRNKLASELSGGHKRKLSLALAVIGNRKVLFLDEPTTGMDPVSRRAVWTYLQSIRADRLVLITTHFMDEADLLADRKAIISQGKLKCVGSSFFLKTVYGVGYHLSVASEQEINSDVQKILTDIITKHISPAEVRRVQSHEMTFLLPTATTPKFADLFRELESLQTYQGGTDDDSLIVGSFGVSVTTLEEVFLRIELENAAENSSNQSASVFDPAAAVTVDISGHEGIELHEVGNSSAERQQLKSDFVCPPLRPSVWQQLVALMKTRFLYEKRIKILWYLRLIQPLILATIGLLLHRSPRHDIDSTYKLKLNSSLYLSTLNGTDGPYASKLLVVMNSSTANGEKFVDAIRSMNTAVEQVPPGTNMLSIAPHHIGIMFGGYSNKSQRAAATVLYNETAIHSLPVGVDVFMNALLRLVAPHAAIYTAAQLWPETDSDRLMHIHETHAGSLTMIIGLAFISIAPSFADGIIKDRLLKCRRQLRVSGISHATYWLSRLFVDSLQYCIPSLMCLLLFCIFQVEAMLVPGALMCVAVLYLLCIVNCLMFVYNLSFFFDDHRTSQIVTPLVVFLLSLIPYFVIDSVESYVQLHDALHYIFLILLPPYGIVRGFNSILMVYVNKVVLVSRVSATWTVLDYLKWDSGVTPVFVCTIISIVLLGLALKLLEATIGEDDERSLLSLCRSRRRKAAGDSMEQDSLLKEDDVDIESQRVDRLDANCGLSNEPIPPVLVRNLVKKYHSRRGFQRQTVAALAGTSFAVEEGEIFGLLGPNGAGKSTLLNSLVAEIRLSSGTVRIVGLEVEARNSRLFRQISYNPQENPVWPLITLEEHLKCYAALRGVASKDIKPLVDRLITLINVEEHRNKLAAKLSGGTKRKLSYLLSTLGDQKVMLFDEPTSGMDPASRRLLWNIIQKSFYGTKRCSILTTHHMEEAEALCGRLAIMVNGQLQCIGSTQHLKSKYGSGYVLELRTKSTDQSPEKLDRIVRPIFVNSDDLKRGTALGDYSTYYIPQSCIKRLSDVFASMEQLKDELVIEEYTFSQSSLEQVFLKFVRDQKSDDVAVDNPTA